MKSILRLRRRMAVGILLFVCSASFLSLHAQPRQSAAIGVTFRSDGHAVMGRFFPGISEENRATVILLHGFPGNEKDVLGLGEKIAEAGMNVLAFNYSGTFRSEGVYGMESTLKDIGSAYEYLHETEVVNGLKIDTTRITLGGYSYGGGMALVYAANHSAIGRVFSIGGTDHGELAREYVRNEEFARSMDEAFEKLKAPGGPVNFEGKGALRKLVENAASVDLRILAPRLAARDILLVGGWDDRMVSFENHLVPFYRSLKNAGASRARVVAYHADHSFRNVRSELADDLIQWLKAPQ